MLEVGLELLRVLGQAIPAIAEGGVVVMGADAGVEADAVDDVSHLEPLVSTLRVTE